MYDTTHFPFTAIVGQEEMKLALVLTAIDRKIGGVLIMGHRGTAKSTAARALAALLPPNKTDDLFAEIQIGERRERVRLQFGEKHHYAPIVDLPLNAGEDRVLGTLDIELVLNEGKKAFEPGLLALAHGGFLYIDEVNLLEDHLVDILLDVAVSGINIVEREGMSIRHPADFVLVGSGNPEEGDLRPQLLDRFGLYTQVDTIRDIRQRTEIILRTEAFKNNPEAFVESWKSQENELRNRIVKAQSLVQQVDISERLIAKTIELCLMLKIDGHRGDIVMIRSSKALAAMEERTEVQVNDIKRVASMCLRHRLRKDPLQEIDSSERIQEALEQLFVG